MRRARALVYASLIGAAGIVAGLSGQAPAAVPLAKEPRHKQLLYTANLRLLDVNIPVADTTLEHMHEHDIATLAIGDSTTRVREAGQDWGAPRLREGGGLTVAEYTGARRAHRIENIGKTPYRVIAVENDRDGGWTTPTAIAAPGTTVAQATRAFTLYDVRLDAATPSTTHQHDVPTVVVLVSGTLTYQGAAGNDPFDITEAGKWVFGPTGSQHTLSAGGTGATRVVEFEAR